MLYDVGKEDGRVGWCLDGEEVGFVGMKVEGKKKRLGQSGLLYPKVAIAEL